MKYFTFKKIHAFTQGESSGNPAGGIYLNSINDISDFEMQLIAKELKGFVSEVVYLFPEEKSIFLRYFSSECEVDFCGHGTIAIMYDYLLNHPELMNLAEIKVRVKNEYLEIINQISKNNSIYITAPVPIFHDVNLDTGNILLALSVPLSSINSNLKLGLINAGLNTLLVPIKDLTQCLKIQPDQNELKLFCLKNEIDIVLIFTNETAIKGNHFRTRVFAPKYGYLEDSATGSGNSAFGYYLLQHKLWNGSQLKIEQNSSFESPNYIQLITQQKNNFVSVLFGGSAIVKIDGVYRINDKQDFKPFYNS